MYLHTDQLAVLVGWHIRTERDVTPKDRIDQIHDRLIKPAITLRKTFDSTDFSKEFLPTWGSLGEVDTLLLANELGRLITAVRAHTEIIRNAGAKGKQWDSDLKDH
jgi:hypothetical protein